jgi:preprotein translocase subunit SecD
MLGQFQQKKAMIINKTPKWQYLLLIVILVVAMIYALPNLFGTDPAVQVSSSIPGALLSSSDLQTVEADLQKAKLDYQSAEVRDKHILVRFNNPDTSLLAKDRLLQSLGNQYLVATTTAAATPAWLMSLNAYPMNLGLDLRGGMSLLLQVDIDDVIQHREQNSVRHIAQVLHDGNLFYSSLIPTDQAVMLQFRDAKVANQAQGILNHELPEFVWALSATDPLLLKGVLSETALAQIRQYTMDQTLNTLNRRVNELGVSEAAVQQEGVDRVSVDLPGVSDATEAQNILGKTATIEAHLVDIEHDAAQAEVSGVVPADDILLKMRDGVPVLLHSQVVLSGDNITSAVSSFNQQSGQPAVSVSVAGSAQSELFKATSDNIGKPMAVVYTEVKSDKKEVHGKTQITYRKESVVINVATIDDAFGTGFEITGLGAAEAQQLSLLLRAGSLPAPVTVLSESQVGPSMGKQNVSRGEISVEIGFILVMIFMGLYYRSMGLIANVALMINLIFIVAIMSLLGGVMTFPGIAGIVLTAGIAVDANVLIFERIREELRMGASVQAAIHAGYERATVTIVDAQLTSLIAAVVLFWIGTGPIKSFATVLIIGLLTSMLTAIIYTRAIVNSLYGGKALKQLPIGIKLS